MRRMRQHTVTVFHEHGSGVRVEQLTVGHVKYERVFCIEVGHDQCPMAIQYIVALALAFQVNPDVDTPLTYASV